MTKLRVGLVSAAFAPEQDGVSGYTAHLAAHLREQGADAVILTADAPAASSAGSAVGVTAGWHLRDLPAAARRLRALDLDVVHVQFAPRGAGRTGRGLGLLPLSLGTGTPLVTSMHDYGRQATGPRWIPASLSPPLLGLAEQRGWWEREAMLLAARAQRLVVTHPAHARLLRARLPRRRDRITEIPAGPNVLPGSLDRATARARLGVRGDVPLLVFFGSVHPVRGVPHLLDAAVRLRTTFPDLLLYVVGRFGGPALAEAEAGAYREEVESLVDQRALGRNVRLTGYLPEGGVSTLLRACDVAVFPRLVGVTARSGSVLAALAHGIPTVATRANPPDPSLGHERHLLLVPPRNSGALAVAITRLLRDPELARRIAADGQRLAQRHAWDRIARAHLELYEGIDRH